MPTESNNRTVNKKLQDEVHQQLAKQPIPKVEQKPKTKMHKWTLFMSFLMVLVMVGSVLYAAVSALGWM